MKPKRRLLTPRKSTAALAVARPKAGSVVQRKRILLVDDHPMMRAGMVQVIEAEPDLQVCGQAATTSDALATVLRDRPDLVIADLTLPGRGGLELLKDLQGRKPAVPVLVVSMHDERLHAERALRAGARGYLMKGAGGEKLVTAIRKVLGGEVYLSEKVSAEILGSFSAHRPRGSHSPIEQLSDREFEVFRLIGNGRTTRDIATRLHLSPKTVDVHRSHIKEKLQIKDVTGLVRYAVRWVETEQAKP